MPVNVVEGRKAGKGLPLDLESLRRADYEQLRTAGFDQLVTSQLAQELAVVDNQHLIAWSGTGIVSPIEFLFGFFPAEGFQPYTTLDTFSDAALLAFRTAVITLTEAIPTVESKLLNQNASPSDVVICQHIGPEEGDYQDFHIQSFAQSHFHIFSSPTGGERQTDYSKGLRNGIREPFSPVIADVISKLGLDITYEKDQGAILIADHVPVLSIDHLRMIAKCMTLWRKIWDELANCFTNFETDNFNRFVPRINSESLDNFCHKHRLSPQSVRLLSFCKSHLQPASHKNAPWSWLSKGVFGSLSMVYHSQEKSWSIRLIPRTRVTDNRTLDMTKSPIKVFDKDRSKRYQPDEERGFIDNQIVVMDSMKVLFDQISSMVILLAIMSGPEPRVGKYQGRESNQ